MTYQIHGIDVTLERRDGWDDDAYVALVADGYDLASIDVRTGVLRSPDGERQAPADMLAEARKVYGPLPRKARKAPAPRKAKKARVLRCHCGKRAVGRSNFGGWACAGHYDTQS